jgi:RimJ/RimL family protein N-acetyltransferase
MEIRAATQSDIPTLMQLERLDGYDRLVGRWEADQHAKEIVNESNRYFVGLEGGAIVAFSILQNVGSANRCIRIRRIIAQSPGHGVGSRFLQSILRICFDEFAAHRVELLVHLENERARHVYAKAGFFEEGILRDLHRNADGSFLSMRIMSLLRPGWPDR